MAGCPGPQEGGWPRSASPEAVLAGWSCAPVTNYLDPAGPHYETSQGAADDPEPAFRIVTFNVEKGERVEQAVAALTRHPELRDADVVVMQEMNAPGVAAVAQALRMNSVYYPASQQAHGGPDWGNAILSRWPIEDGRKILLPHLSLGTQRGRIATVARVRRPTGAVRVYSVHLGSPLGMGEGSRREQAARDPRRCREQHGAGGGGGRLQQPGHRRVLPRARLLLADPPHRPDDIAAVVRPRFRARGWCAERPEALRAGVARDVKDASDHRPVWVVLGG